MNMRCFRIGHYLLLLACLLLCAAPWLRMDAQTRRQGRLRPRLVARRQGTPDTAAPPGASQMMQELGATVAILPWSYRNGKDAAVQSAREVCNQLLLNTGFNVFLIKSPIGAMPPATPGSPHKSQPFFASLLNQGRSVVGMDPTNWAEGSYELPTEEQMAEIGQRLGARYVLAGRAQWRRKDVWVGLSNRTKSICTVDILILDADNQRLVLSARNVEGDSTENKNLFNSITSAISLNPLPLVLPGSVTPQEQHAAEVAIARAVAPWIRKEHVQVALAEADQSAAPEETTEPAGAPFSSLVRPVTDLQASLLVTEPDGNPAGVVGKDLADLYGDHTVTLSYKDPNKLRISADSPRNGEQVLIVNEEDQSYQTPERKSKHTQDLSNAPDRRLSLLDFCGLLTPGMFDFMRARFVRQDTLDGGPAVVYDLTFWGYEEGAFRRLWIDPKTRTVLRNELHDRNGKIRSITLYDQPEEVASGIMLPMRVHVENAASVEVATLRLSKVKVNRGVSDSLFTLARPAHGGFKLRL
ncbi:MAG TPA: outer membrane lipoprotein-sorting protein [Chthonomonadaceae bacterium]|nr:outer membrane lipoprotein-sorting protein [Chthonomonadaceae bacterium]